MPKVSITKVPTFFERDRSKGVCAGCSAHRYIIVQKIGSVNYMHTAVPPGHLERALHSWDTYNLPPPCFHSYVPVKPVETPKQKAKATTPSTIKKIITFTNDGASSLDIPSMQLEDIAEIFTDQDFDDLDSDL